MLIVLVFVLCHGVLCCAGERWAKTVDSLKQNYDVLTGDMLLAAAFISYAGPFTNKYRASLIKEWMKFLTDRGTPMTAGITGEQMLAYACRDCCLC
jgi:dynein heavy chain